MSRETSPAPVLDARVRVDNLPAGGRELDVVANEAGRIELTGRLKVTSIEHLQANLNVAPFRGGLRVTGQVRAAVTQPCVVTFVPVHQQIQEPVDRVFLPANHQKSHAPSAKEIFIDPDEDDPPDYFEGAEADLTELVTETVALAIDPYPRAPDAELELPKDLGDAEVSPFAVLQKLRKEDDRG